MVREMVPIALACVIWGREWSHKKLLFHCDNASVVQAWRSGTRRNKKAMALIRSMLFVAAKYNFILLIELIAGIDNGVADALSRLQVSRFRELVPAACPQPVPMPSLDSLF